MNLILKQFLIIGLTFFIILWFQEQDDKKHNKVRELYYDKYKFPIFVSSIIGLILNLSTNTLNDIAIITHNCEPVKNCDISKTFVHNNNFNTNNLKNEQMSWFNKQASEQKIFTELPDF